MQSYKGIFFYEDIFLRSRSFFPNVYVICILLPKIKQHFFVVLKAWIRGSPVGYFK